MDDSHAKNLRGDDLNSFMGLWQRWREEFPESLKLVTLAIPHPSMGVGRGIQFRIWFGEPASIRRGYVDSMGHNLAVHFYDTEPGNALLYRLLAEHLLQGHSFSKETVDEVEVWRLK